MEMFENFTDVRRIESHLIEQDVQLSQDDGAE
jgi:hypothetical protein